LSIWKPRGSSRSSQPATSDPASANSSAPAATATRFAAQCHLVVVTEDVVDKGEPRDTV
jgi:hypothetical protein